MSVSAAVRDARLALGEQLAAYRRASGFSQAELALLVNFSRSTIANVETGRQHVPTAFWDSADAALHARGALIEANVKVEATARDEQKRAASLQPPEAQEDIQGLMAWVASSSTTDDAIEQIARATA
ncbi:MAG TPA: helix-turn-helix transcriptional regulator [Streptosporangiaceae bacterium]|nr:helix-turn-helix transcriptional regulator [Streptosporangiaceae bacterium]